MWLRTTVYLFFLTTIVTFAQIPGGTTNPTVPVQSSQPTTPSIGETSSKGNAKISGYALDSTMTKAVEFANVALYETTSGKLIDGAVADEKGKFTLTKLAPGTYKLLISFLGYTAKAVDNIVLSKGQTKDIGVVRLTASTRTLGEVTVAGKKALVEDKVDRLIYNADNDVAAKGGDALDILKIGRAHV